MDNAEHKHEWKPLSSDPVSSDICECGAEKTVEGKVYPAPSFDQAKEEALKLPVQHTCPRRDENFLQNEKFQDIWRPPNADCPYQTCSWCGSIHPDEFMKGIEAGDKIVPTDKSYKAYLRKRRDDGSYGSQQS